MAVVIAIAVVYGGGKKQPSKESVSGLFQGAAASSSAPSFAPPLASDQEEVDANATIIDVAPVAATDFPTGSPTDSPTSSPVDALADAFAPQTALPTDAGSFGVATSPSTTPVANPVTAAPISPPKTGAPSVSPTERPAPMVTARGSFELLETLPHDASAFTQGLEVLSLQRLQHGQNASATTATTTTTSTEYFLESTGQYGQSSMRLVDIATGSVVEELDLSSSYFGEGCTYYEVPSDDPNVKKLKILQLTWQSGVGAVYDLDISLDTTDAAERSPLPANLEYTGFFDINTTSSEGWGIVYHPILDQFIVSDGSSNLHFWELREDNGSKLVFDLVRTLPVLRRFSADSEWGNVQRLNELEWDPHSYGGMTILANVWQAEHVVRIRLEDGIVSHQYKFETLERPATADVLNGIAAVWDSTPSSMGDASKDQFYITGKYWSQMYRVRLID